MTEGRRSEDFCMRGLLGMKMVWSGHGRVTTGMEYTEGMREGMIVRGNGVSEARKFKVSIYLFEPVGCWRLSFEMLSQ